MQALAATHVDDVWIGWRYGQCAYGTGRLVVEDGLPDAAVIGGFPDSAVVCRHVEDTRLAGDAFGGNRAAAAVRTDHAPSHVAIGVERELLGEKSGGKEGDNQAHLL